MNEYQMRRLQSRLRDLRWFIVFDAVNPGLMTIYQPAGIDDPEDGWRNSNNMFLQAVLTIAMPTREQALKLLAQEVAYRLNEIPASPLSSSTFQSI